MEWDIFSNYDSEIDGFGCKEVWISIFFKLGLQVIRGDDDQVLVVLNCEYFFSNLRDGLYFLIDTEPYRLRQKETKAIKHNFKLDQVRSLWIADDKFSVVHTDFLEKDSPKAPAWAIMPGYWPEPWTIDTDYTEECFLDEDDSDKLGNILDSIGWTEDEMFARILLGSASENMSFYPSKPQMDSTGKIFRNGSLGASLFYNATKASKENRITDLLIERVALTANSGLEFYEAMLEEHRAAINQI